MVTNDTNEARSPNSPYASAGAGVVEPLKAPATALRGGEPTDPQEANPGHQVQSTLTTCARCRQSIVQGVITGASQTWATAVEGDPWCQGGAHLPKAVR
jgi:hypothetical protein